MRELGPFMSASVWPRGEPPVDVAANTGTYLYLPFRSLEDYALRGTSVGYIQADNEALLASIASHAGVAQSPMVEEWKLRARRRGLVGVRETWLFRSQEQHPRSRGKQA